LLFLLLLATCPHLLRFGIRRDWRIIIVCFTAIAAIAAWFLTKAFAIPCFIICAFGLFNLISDVVGYERSITKRKREDPSVKRNLRWYGTRIVHIGVVLVFVGIAGSGGYDKDEYFALKPGDKITIDSFDIVYDDLRAENGPNFLAIVADLSVFKEGELLSKLSPSKAYYEKSEKPVSEVAIRRTLAYDLYTALTEADADSKLINLRVLIKPLINWIWLGSILSTVGVLVVLASFYKRKQVINQIEM
jgi:cytochrome c-type biogenesis protein CcmF